MENLNNIIKSLNPSKSHVKEINKELNKLIKKANTMELVASDMEEQAFMYHCENRKLRNRIEALEKLVIISTKETLSVTLLDNESINFAFDNDIDNIFGVKKDLAEVNSWFEGFKLYTPRLKTIEDVRKARKQINKIYSNFKKQINEIRPNTI